MADFKVVIAEDDQYSCDLMSFLLTRDRRIRVAAEGVDAMHRLEQGDPTVLDADAVLLDTELPWDAEGWALAQVQQLRSRQTNPRIICLATVPGETLLRDLVEAGIDGYVLKDEVHYALGAMVVNAIAGNWVTTPGVAHLARLKEIHLPEPILIINGTARMERLQGNDLMIARLCLLFSQPYKDVADELGVRTGHIADQVAELYEKIGLNAILSGAVAPEEYFSDEEILTLFNDAITQRRVNPRTRPDMKTLAFHLITLPEIDRKNNQELCKGV